MKNVKTILIALMAIATLVACKGDDDNNDTAFLLSNSNFAGTHDLTYLESTIITTTEVQGIPVTATTTVVGDTFQVIFVVQDNGTFTVEGQYRITTTVTVAGQTETDTEILVVDDTGNYTINANAQTITFTGVDGFSSVWDVTLFNENEVRLTNMETDVEEDFTSESTSEIRIVRQ